MRNGGKQERQWWLRIKGRRLLASIAFWLRKLWMLVKWISGPAEYVNASYDGEKLNDSLYSWYEPNDPELEILFFHGLVPTACEDIHRKAWTNGFGECWPEKWLQDEQGFPRARILAVKYDSSLKKTTSAGVYALRLVSETLATDLIDLGNIGQTGRPVVLVGYDLGGIVIKSLCVHVQTSVALDTRDISEERRHKFERFLNNVRGVFYFSTPHHGLFSSISEFDGELAECLRIFSTQTARLNEDFWKLRDSRKWGTAGVASAVDDTEVSGCSAEATNRCDTDILIVLHERRESINKLCSRFSSSFQFFVDSVKTFIQCHRVEDVDERFQDFIRENVGLEDSVQQVTSLLASLERAEAGINAVVLHGMGGIGKSTLGDAVFLKLSRKFDPDCRLWLDREANSISPLPISDLQLSIIKRLSLRSEPISGRKQIRQKLRECYKKANRPLLIFIDSIEKEDELEEIFPGSINDLLPQRSYILIASRNLRMCTTLRNLGQTYASPDCSRLHGVVPKVCLYRVKPLDERSAEKLFRQFAVMQQLSQSSILQTQKLMRKVLDICGGLPLALKVMGAALAVTPSSDWSDVLQRLEDCKPVDGTTEDKLNRSLQFSYSQLQEKIQQAFLDIVFCFNGSPWNQLKVMYGDDLNILEQRALIMKEEREEYGSSFSYPTVKVHALFVALGKREAKASGSHISVEGERYLRLQDIDLKTGKDAPVVLVLQGNRTRLWHGMKETTRRHGNFPSCKWKSEGFSRTLRILVLRNLLIQGAFCMDEVPQNLECLVCFNSNMPFPNGNLTSLEKLKYVDILTTVDDQHSYSFPGGVQHLRLENRTLKELTFGSDHNDSTSHALKEFGLMSAANLLVNFRIGQFQSLRKLVLTNIIGLDNNLPDELFQLKSLQSLSIENCHHISSLPDFYTERLEHLHLALPDLIELPDTLKSLNNLRSLYLDRCFRLKHLPHDAHRHLNPNFDLIAVNGCKNLNLPLLGFVKTVAVDKITESSVLELQVSNVSKWTYYTRRKFDQQFLEESSAAIQMPPMIRQVNEYIYELYTPKEEPHMDIVFFHSLQLDGTDNLHLSTWTSEDGGNYHVWPKTWLPEDFPNARVLTVAYDAQPDRTEEQGRLDLQNTAENLLNSLLFEEETPSCRPLVLVGYEIGGILIKQLCLHASRKMFNNPRRQLTSFLERIRGIYFMGTPHLGMDHEGFGLAAQENLEALSETLARLHEEFCRLQREYWWKIYSIAAIKSTRQDSLQTLRVREGSSRFGDSCIMVSSEQRSLSKPSDRISHEYLVLHSLIESVQRSISCTEGPSLVHLPARFEPMGDPMRSWEYVAAHAKALSLYMNEVIRNDMDQNLVPACEDLFALVKERVEQRKKDQEELFSRVFSRNPVPRPGQLNPVSIPPSSFEQLEFLSSLQSRGYLDWLDTTERTQSTESMRLLDPELMERWTNVTSFTQYLVSSCTGVFGLMQELYSAYDLLSMTRKQMREQLDEVARCQHRFNCQFTRNIETGALLEIMYGLLDKADPTGKYFPEYEEKVNEMRRQLDRYQEFWFRSRRTDMGHAELRRQFFADSGDPYDPRSTRDRVNLQEERGASGPSSSNAGPTPPDSPGMVK